MPGLQNWPLVGWQKSLMVAGCLGGGWGGTGNTEAKNFPSCFTPLALQWLSLGPSQSWELEISPGLPGGWQECSQLGRSPCLPVSTGSWSKQAELCVELCPPDWAKDLPF